ncbi:hypothetical protein FRC07_012689 [Ceratobasidium sp. 392]|nr:hypothetical protein FRC07_012689 [Ceratobasidium sp. 392]
MAIYTGRKTETRAHGIYIIEEIWDSSTERFGFDHERMVETRIIPKLTSPNQQAERLEHKEPWTIAGRDEYQSQLQKGQGV